MDCFCRRVTPAVVTLLVLVLAAAVIPVTAGCRNKPKKPEHGHRKCSSFSGCKLWCDEGFFFPGDLTQLIVMCRNGKWEVKDYEISRVPDRCEPPSTKSKFYTVTIVTPTKILTPDATFITSTEVADVLTTATVIGTTRTETSGLSTSPQLETTKRILMPGGITELSDVNATDITPNNSTAMMAASQSPEVQRKASFRHEREFSHDETPLQDSSVTAGEVVGIAAGCLAVVACLAGLGILTVLMKSVKVGQAPAPSDPPSPLSNWTYGSTAGLLHI